MGRIPKSIVLALMKSNTERVVNETATLLLLDYIERTIIEITKTADRLAVLKKSRSITPVDVQIAIEQVEQRRGKI